MSVTTSNADQANGTPAEFAGLNEAQIWNKLNDLHGGSGGVRSGIYLGVDHFGNPVYDYILPSTQSRPTSNSVADYTSFIFDPALLTVGAAPFPKYNLSVGGGTPSGEYVAAERQNHERTTTIRAALAAAKPAWVRAFGF